MVGNTKIQWCESVWNPIVGCSIVSAGCKNCYAMRQAARLLDKPGSHYEGTTRIVNGKPVWTGKVALAPEHILGAPLRRRKPTVYFVNSMGDLFHPDVPYEWIDRVFAVMALCPQHIFQVLTKRPARMRGYMREFNARRTDSLGSKVLALGYEEPLELLRWPLPNVWLGISAEDQARFDEREGALWETPAAIRFISFEPLLGPIECGWGDKGSAPDWAIIGGESGPDARPMNLAWARDLVVQCRAAGVSAFVKQLGHRYRDGGEIGRLIDPKGGDMAEWPADLRVRQFPAQAGRAAP